MVSLLYAFVDWSFTQIVVGATLAWLAYSTASGIYNIYFHPLARYPGPRWAVATKWWKVYVEVYKRESIVDKLFDLHKIYGDVIRIAPNELHFAKPSVYHEIYSPRSKWDKDPAMYSAFGEDISTFSTVEYREAKKRKDLIAAHFSRKSVLQMQNLIQKGLDNLCPIIRARCEAGKVTDIWRAFRCVSFDNITSYCFGYTLDAVHAPDFKCLILEQMHDGLGGYQFFKHFQSVKNLAVLLTQLALRVISTEGREGNIQLYHMNKKQIDNILADPSLLSDAPHPIVYHSLLDSSSSLKLSKPSLRDEATMLVVAGVDTVSNASTIAAVWTTCQGDEDRLREELRQVWPRMEEPPSLEVLEGLPYLKAVCKESLRLSHGVYSPMMRVVPPEGATLDGRFVPGGTIVGMSNLFVHLNPDIFPEPHKFRPDRWLEPGAEALDTWLVAFSKGPRSCLGINLGWCELLMNVATLFRRFSVGMPGACYPLFAGGNQFRTTPYDLFYQDCFLPFKGGPDLEFHLVPEKL